MDNHWNIITQYWLFFPQDAVAATKSGSSGNLSYLSESQNRGYTSLDMEYPNRDKYHGLLGKQAAEARANLKRYLELAFEITSECNLRRTVVVDNPPPESTMKERSNNNQTI